MGNLHFGKKVLIERYTILEPLLYVDVTVMLYSVLLCSPSMVYLEPPSMSGYMTLPDIVTLCDTSPHDGWL